MTKVLYKCFDANGELIEIVKTLAEAKNLAMKFKGRYEVYYTYRESYSVGYAWKFKRMSGHQT